MAISLGFSTLSSTTGRVEIVGATLAAGLATSLGFGSSWRKHVSEQYRGGSALWDQHMPLGKNLTWTLKTTGFVEEQTCLPWSICQGPWFVGPGVQPSPTLVLLWRFLLLVIFLIKVLLGCIFQQIILDFLQVQVVIDVLALESSLSLSLPSLSDPTITGSFTENAPPQKKKETRRCQI